MANRFSGQRALRIALRTLHIGAAGVVLGASTLGVAAGPWWLYAIATGMAMVAEELYRHGPDWIRYLQAWTILTKLAVLVIASRHPSWAAPALWISLALGSVIAHAPGALRQYPLWGPPGPCARPKLPSSTGS